VWAGTPDAGAWELVLDAAGETVRTRAEHLIVANGHNHHPHIPPFAAGVDAAAWLAGAPGRTLEHSIYWRTPALFANRSVLVVGSSASGRDIAARLVPVARALFVSHTPKPYLPPLDFPENVTVVPRTAGFNATSVLLEGGGAVHGVDAVVLATGYEFCVPFLRGLNRAAAAPTPDALSTNGRYITPLHAHIFSLDASHPPTALAFIGLPIGVPNAASDAAQTRLLAHALVDPAVLPPRAELLRRLHAAEDATRARGRDPAVQGHWLTEWRGEPSDYADSLLEFLRAHGREPPGPPQTESWRRRNWGERVGGLRNAWRMVEEKGPEEVRRWLAGVRTEEQWVGLLEQLEKWAEAEQGRC
jgi:hypothetical protein